MNKFPPLSSLPQEEKKATATSEISSQSTNPKKLFLFHNKEKHQPGSLTHNQKQQQKEGEKKKKSKLSCRSGLLKSCTHIINCGNCFLIKLGVHIAI